MENKFKEIKFIGNKGIVAAMQEMLGEDKEVYETAMYAMAAIVVQDQVISAMTLKKTEVSGIPPESIALMRKYENGLVKNSFFLENYAPIKVQIALADIKLETTRAYLLAHQNSGQIEFLESIKGILLSKLDVLTTIAFLWKGMDFAKSFDARCRVNLQLSSEYKNILG